MGFLNGIQPREPSPTITGQTKMYSDYDASGDGKPYLNLTVEGGDTLKAEDLKLIVRLNGTRYDGFDPNGTDGGTIVSGDSLQYDLSKTNVCTSNASAFETTLVHEPSNSVLLDERVNVQQRVNATTDGNVVSATGQYEATVKILGLASSKSGTGNTIKMAPVGARVVVNTDSGTEYLTPWPDGDPHDGYEGPLVDDVNFPNANPPHSYTTKKLGPSDSVSLEVRTDLPNDWNSTGSTVTRDGTTYQVKAPDKSAGIDTPYFWVDSTDSTEGNLILLQNGDTVPTYGVATPYQRSLQEILGSRMDASGKLQLDHDEVVVLYDLTDPDAQPWKAPPPGSTGNPDYNDVVALIDVDPVSSGGSGGKQSTAGTVYCD